MQSRARAEENRNFQNAQGVAMRASTNIHSADNSRRLRFAGSFLCGMVCAALPAITLAQAPPQTLPGYHTVVAGTGTQYTPVTLVNGAISGTPVHGSAPGDGSAATSAPLNGPNALAFDSLGNLYIVDSSGPVRRVDTTGTITTFAAGLNFQGGKAKSPYQCAAASALATAGTKNVYPTYGDGCSGNETYLSGAGGIAIDPASGDIYISESSGYRIRKISHSTYLVSTVAGSGTKGGANGDLDVCSGTCSGTVGTLSGTRGLAVDKHGNLYLADTGNSAIRLANFTTGQLTTVVNTNETVATAATCTTNATATNAGAAITGSVQSVVFDSADNMYFTDAACNVVYKVAEDPATHIVDANSTISVVLGSGSGAAQTTFTNVPGTQVNITPAGLQVDLLGNLYVGESTGSHVWFWDAKTGTMHTVFGGSATPGNCYQVGGSIAPYNGCDGQDSSPATVKGTPGLALDPWGNLYIADTAGFYVHKLALGTNAPTATVPGGFGNALVHFGAGDNPGSVSLTSAPDFSFNLQSASCVSNSDTTEDCPYLVINNSSATPLYEQAVVNSGKGLSTVVPLTSQAYPTCQPSAAATEKIAYMGATSVTLNATPGAACAGFEAVANAPHKYTYAIVTQPASGTLSAVNGNGVTYTPNSGFTGTDSFTYSVTDNSTFSGQTVTYDVGQPPTSTIVLAAPTPTAGTTATVTLPPYTPPVATQQSVTVANATATVITLSGTASNGSALTYSIATPPGHGTLSAISGSSVTYTPTGTYFGADSFTFTVNDGTASSAAATVSLTVNPPAPTANPVTATVNFQTATAITLSATGQGTLTYSIPTGGSQTGPTHGSLGTVSGSSVTYTPAAGYSGSDQFVFAVSNGGGSSQASVSITVNPAPVIPVAQPSSATVVYNTATTITAIAGGGDGNLLTYKVASAPAHGSLGAFSGANIVYTPNSTYSGSDSFQFTAADDKNTSAPATISITVTLPPPVANNQSATTAFQTALPITLVATGPGTITYPTVATPAHGTLTGTAPNLTYTPSANYVGTDSFTFKASNGALSNVATVSITVSAPAVPVAGSQTLSTPYQTALPVTLSATGLGTITYAVATQPAHGTLSGTAPALTYTPTAGYYGPDSFTFTATNPGGPATGTITITDAPPPPVAQAGTAIAPSGVPTPITLAATGAGTITYSVVTKPAHGTYTISGAVVTYTSNASYFGADSFTFQANNGSASNTVQVSITVNPPPPSASSATVTTAFNTATAINLAVTQLNGAGTIAYTIVANPTNGKLTGTAPALTYTPNAGFAGSDTFTFTASNAGGPSNVATVTITVNQGFTWAVASGSSASATVTQGSAATYNLMLAGWTGATGPVTFTCSGAAINCYATPNPATLNGTTQIPITITIATTVNPPSTLGFGAGRLGWFSLLGLGGCLLLLPLRKRKPLLLGMLALVTIAALSVGLSGCGAVRQDPFGTAKGTYTFTVTATTANATGTQAITLIVQ